MLYKLCALAVALLSPTAVFGQDRFGETCRGTETIKVGANPPRVGPYVITLSIDLRTGYYCYAACEPEQTYAIADRRSDPIRLADLGGDLQERHMSFSRTTGVLRDVQRLTLLSTVSRDASRRAARPHFTSRRHDPEGDSWSRIGRLKGRRSVGLASEAAPAFRESNAAIHPRSNGPLPFTLAWRAAGPGRSR